MAQGRKGGLKGVRKSIIRGEEGVCEMRRAASGVQNGGCKGGPSGAFC